MFNFIGGKSHEKDNDNKGKINLSFDNLAIPEVHLHRTHKDNANADTNNENTVKKSVASQSVEGNESTDSKRKKHQLVLIQFAIPEIHIKNK